MSDVRNRAGRVEVRIHAPLDFCDDCDFCAAAYLSVLFLPLIETGSGTSSLCKSDLVSQW